MAEGWWGLSGGPDVDEGRVELPEKPARPPVEIVREGLWEPGGFVSRVFRDVVVSLLSGGIIAFLVFLGHSLLH